MRKIKRTITVRKIEIVRQQTGDSERWTCPLCNTALPLQSIETDAHGAATEPSPKASKDRTAEFEGDEKDDD